MDEKIEDAASWLERLAETDAEPLDAEDWALPPEDMSAYAGLGVEISWIKGVGWIYSSE
jgi:hypothetical protein